MLDLRTREDLQRLVDERLQESLTLEYKASPALTRTNDGRSELVKDVTAMANAAGGQIVYGIREQHGAPTGIDEGVDRNQFTPEWIEQVIGTNSSPRLQSLGIAEIPLTEDRSRVAYVITVPQSEAFAPHQNTIDHKYYRRFERRSVPMADYEIRDTMLRIQKPVLEVKFTFPNSEELFELADEHEVLAVRPWLTNHSPEPSLYSLFKIFIDARLEVGSIPGGLTDKEAQAILWGNEYKLYEKQYSVPSDFPLVRGISHTFVKPDFALRIPKRYFKDGATFMLAYQSVAAPGAITQGVQSFKVRGRALILSPPILVMKDGISMLSPINDEDQGVASDDIAN